MRAVSAERRQALNLDPLEASEWARRLKQTEHTCGCKSGAALMLAAIVGWPVWVVLSGIPRASLSIAGAVLTYAGVVIASAVIGKLAGIAAGRLRHRRVKHQLACRLAGLAAEQRS